MPLTSQVYKLANDGLLMELSGGLQLARRASLFTFPLEDVSEEGEGRRRRREEEGGGRREEEEEEEEGGGGRRREEEGGRRRNGEVKEGGQ